MATVLLLGFGGLTSPIVDALDAQPDISSSRMTQHQLSQSDRLYCY